MTDPVDLLAEAIQKMYEEFPAISDHGAVKGCAECWPGYGPCQKHATDRWPSWDKQHKKLLES